jgi:hypothetical protein
MAQRERQRTALAYDVDTETTNLGHAHRKINLSGPMQDVDAIRREDAHDELIYLGNRRRGELGRAQRATYTKVRYRKRLDVKV